MEEDEYNYYLEHPERNPYIQTSTPIKSKKKGKDGPRGAALRHKFNISLADYDQMIEDQDNKCLICQKQLGQDERNDPVDHNHKTGKIRGVLCINCNLRLGWYEKYKITIHKYCKRGKI